MKLPKRHTVVVAIHDVEDAESVAAAAASAALSLLTQVSASQRGGVSIERFDWQRPA